MSEAKPIIKVEERIFFMWLLTFIGGYSNAYSYFTRGGAFVSFHTGNITKIGLSAVTMDSVMFRSAIVPICGALLGAVIGQLVKTALSRKSTRFWQRSALAVELTAFLVVGLIPKTYSNDAVNFFLSIVTMFQLSNFRSLEGSVHNTTIETGNLRTFGQYCGDFLWKRNLPSLQKAARYFAVLAAFPLGTLVGGLLCGVLHVRAIWICCLPLAALLCSLPKE